MRRLALILALSFAIAPLAPRLEAKKLAKSYYHRSSKSKTKRRTKNKSARGRGRSKGSSRARAN